MEEIYVADPLADKLIDEYPDYYFEDVGTGVIFSVPENKAGNKFIRLVNKLSNSVNEILAKYSEEKKISFIMPKKNIVIGRSELDITNDILIIVDDKIKKISIK